MMSNWMQEMRLAARSLMAQGKIADVTAHLADVCPVDVDADRRLGPSVGDYVDVADGRRDAVDLARLHQV